MQKIALIEIYRHSELVRPLCHLLTGVGCELLVLTNQEVWADCYDAPESVEWRLRPEGQLASVFLATHTALVNTYQLVLFITLKPSDTFICQWPIQPKKILIIHSAHTFLSPLHHLALFRSGQDWGMNLLRAIKWGVMRHAYKAQRMLATMDYLSFTDAIIQAYSQQQFPKQLAPYQLLPPLPYLFFEEKEPLIHSPQAICIVLPGSVRAKDRDYASVLNALQMIIPDLSVPLEWVFLGNAGSKYGQQTIRAFRKLESPFFQVISFDAVVSQQTFDHYLQKASFLLLSIKRHHRLGAVQEEYSKSTITGNVGDAIRYGTPTLLNAWYEVPDFLQALIQPFHSQEDLARYLSDWIYKRKFESVRETFLPKLRKRNQAIIQQELLRLINTTGEKGD